MCLRKHEQNQRKLQLLNRVPQTMMNSIDYCQMKMHYLNKEINDIKKEMKMFQAQLEQLYKLVTKDHICAHFQSNKDFQNANQDSCFIDNQSCIYNSLQSDNRKSIPLKSTKSKEKKLMNFLKNNNKFSEEIKDNLEIPLFYHIKEEADNVSLQENTISEKDYCIKKPYPSSRNKIMPKQFHKENQSTSRNELKLQPAFDYEIKRQKQMILKHQSSSNLKDTECYCDEGDHICGLYCKHLSAQSQKEIVFGNDSYNQYIPRSLQDVEYIISAKWWRKWCDFVNIEARSYNYLLKNYESISNKSDLFTLK